MAKRKPWIGLVLPRNYLTALGEFLAQWAFMEREFDALLRGMLLHPDTKKWAKKSPFAFSQRLKLFRRCSAVCFSESEALMNRLERIADDISNIKDERDHLAHGIWTVSEVGKKKEISVYLQRPSGNLATKNISIDFLRTHIAISALSRRIMAVKNATAPFGQDYSFPISASERMAISNYLVKNLKIPKPFTAEK